MNWTMAFTVLGVFYFSYLLTKALIWIDTPRKR